MGIKSSHIPTNRHPADSRRAAALIVAIWIIGLLSLLIGSFAFQAHLEARITSYYRKRLQAETLAKAGVERARVLLVDSLAARRRLGSDPTAEEQEKPFWEAARQLARGMPLRNLVDPLGPGKIHLTILPEQARFNINRLHETDWARILEMCQVPERLWDGLIDAFMDWIDPDNEVRLDGAEADYYIDLDPPYRPRNGDIESIAELLLIKGFTPEIVYGGMPAEAHPDDPVMTGLADLFTTVGDGKINVNAAARRVLMALPGIDEQTAQDIIYEREGAFLEEWQREDAGFRDVANFEQRFPGLAADLKERIVTAVQLHRIESVGAVDGVERSIRLTAEFDGQNFRVLRWLEAENF